MSHDLPQLLRSLADAEETFDKLKRDCHEHLARVQDLRAQVVRMITMASSTSSFQAALTLPFDAVVPDAPFVKEVVGESIAPAPKRRRGTRKPSPQFFALKDRYLKAIEDASPEGITANALRAIASPDERTLHGPVFSWLQAKNVVRKVGDDRWVLI